MIKLNLYNVTDTATGVKVKVNYHESERQGTKCVKVYSKEYGNSLGRIFSSVVNNTETMTDYFETDQVILKPGDEHYDAALKNARRLAQKRRERWEAKFGKAA